ncbi:MAG: TonB-dependent receptor [Rhodocyclales bacterium]|nr:TonB-dependent receptor [Rhodocyclales bacterium]
MQIKAIPYALAALFAATSHAAQSSPAGSSGVTLDDVPVRATPLGALPATQALPAVNTLGRAQVDGEAVMNSWELLGRVPGIQLTEIRMGIESGRISFRGFNGEGYINGIKLLIDGIPGNTNNGNPRFIDMVSPLELESLEVVKGGSDPRYGLHNIGGNVNVLTRQGGNYSVSRLTYGSFNTREIQLALGREADNWAQNYVLERQTSDGYRDHAHSEKYTVGGKWFYTADGGQWAAGLSARFHHNEAQEAGFLTASELAARRSQSPARNANDGGDRDMQQWGIHLDVALSEQLSLSNLVYFNSHVEDRRITFSSFPYYNLPRQQRQWDETQTGLRSTLTWRAGPGFSLEGGLNLEHQDNEYRRYTYRYTLPTNFAAAPASVLNNENYTLDNLGGYIQAVLQPIPALRITPAFRLDKFEGESLSRISGARADLQDYGWIRQPKLGLAYTVQPGLELYASWGKTFQILTGSQAPAYLSTGQQAWRPSINISREVGSTWKPWAGGELRLAFWQQTASDEMANLPSIGASLDLGPTRRRGVDFEFSQAVGERGRVWFSHTLQESTVMGGSAGGMPLAHREAFATPRYITNMGAEYQIDERWRLSLQGRAQGDYYIYTLAAPGKYGSYAVADLGARYTLSPQASIDLQIRNLLDRKYEYVWFDSAFWGPQAQPMFSPAPGRAAYVALNLRM